MSGESTKVAALRDWLSISLWKATNKQYDSESLGYVEEIYWKKPFKVELTMRNVKLLDDFCLTPDNWSSVAM